MTYRVTVSLGRPSLDTASLDDEGARLTKVLPASCEVLVDPVKATLQVTMTSPETSALDAAAASTVLLCGVFRIAGLAMPTSIVTLEAEAVPPPAEEAPKPHVVTTPA